LTKYDFTTLLDHYISKEVTNFINIKQRTTWYGSCWCCFC